jgi:aerobic carbon-monoxide dehydrogenase medium subunit
VIPRFALVRPSSLGEAFAAFDAASGDAAWYAGGTELLQVMKMGLAHFGTLIDLKGLPELRGVSVGTDGALIIGGGTSHRELERSETIGRELPGLTLLEAHVANVRVRNQGTIGGNLSFAEPHSDPATFLLACDARIHLVGPNGARVLAMDEFLISPFETARDSGEILVAIEVPAARRGQGRAYQKAKFRERPAVSVGVRIVVVGDTIAEARVTVGSATDIPIRVPDAETVLVGTPADPASLQEAQAAAQPMAHIDATGDLDGSPDFKRHLAGVLLGRAILDGLAEVTARA